MPAFLLSPTFWKIAGVALLALAVSIAISIFVAHYKHITAQAALVPALQKANKDLVTQAARDDSRAADAAIKLVVAEAKRDQAVADQAKFHDLAGQIGTTIQGIARNANATKNPVCLPSDAERLLFNTAIARYTNPNAGAGPRGTSSALPSGPH